MEEIHHELESALARMTWQFETGEFALVGFAGPPAAADLDLIRTGPAQLVVEADETTLLIPTERLDEALRLHPEAKVEPGQLWLRFAAPMSWDLVGFLALVCGRFAAAGIPVGAICGFHRDHLFFAKRYETVARAALEELMPGR